MAKIAVLPQPGVDRFRRLVDHLQTHRRRHLQEQEEPEPEEEPCGTCGYAESETEDDEPSTDPVPTDTRFETNLGEALKPRRQLQELFGGAKASPDRVEVDVRGKDAYFTYTFLFPLDPGRSPLSDHLTKMAALARSAEKRTQSDSEYAAIEALKQTREKGWDGWKRSSRQPPEVRTTGGQLELKTRHIISYAEPLTPEEARDIERELHDWLR